MSTISKIERDNKSNYFSEVLLKSASGMFIFAIKDTWGKRRGAFLPSRSFNQLWKERQQK
jgi:hypothetical protein